MGQGSAVMAEKGPENAPPRLAKDGLVARSLPAGSEAMPVRPAATAAAVRLRPSPRSFLPLMKIALPAVAVGLVSLVLAWPHFFTEEGANPDIAAPAAAATWELGMLSPRYVGVDDKDRPFAVTARAVRSSSPGAETMALTDPEAEMTLEDGSWVWARADEGDFSRAANTLDLAGSVQVVQDGGYAFDTTRARVDLATKDIAGNEAVRGQGPVGHLAGEGFEIREQGNRVLVTGRSTLTLYPGALHRAP